MSNEHTHEAKAAPAVPQGFTFEQLADACAEAGVSDSKFEAIVLSLKTTPSAPSQPVKEQEILVGLSIHGKELRNENIVYDGGPLDLTDCKLLRCSISFSKAAARTVQFLAIAEQSQPGFLQPLFADAVRLTKPSQEPVTAALRDLVAAVQKEMSPDWICSSYHPHLHSALYTAIAALREKG